MSVLVLITSINEIMSPTDFDYEAANVTARV